MKKILLFAAGLITSLGMFAAGNGATATGTITGTFPNSQLNGVTEDHAFTMTWSATWNTDETVTFDINVDPVVTGLSPQIFENGAYKYTFPGGGPQFTLTTGDTYQQGTKPFSFYFAYLGSNTEQIALDYTVGESTTGGTTDPGTGGGGDNTGDTDTGNGATATGTLTGTFSNSQIPGSSDSADRPYTIDWSATWNTNGTVTIKLTIDPVVTGLVPKLYVDNAYKGDFSANGSEFTYTTTDKYTEGATPFSIEMAYAGGVANATLNYSVGASGNVDSGTGDGGDSGNDSGDDTGNGNGNTYSGTLKGTFTSSMLPGSDETADRPYTINWSATWNTNETVTITLDIDPVVTGLVPQLFANDSYSNFTDTGSNFTITTTDKFNEGTKPFSLYITYAGGLVPLTELNYTVGASGNETPSTGDNTGDDDDDDDNGDDTVGNGLSYTGQIKTVLTNSHLTADEAYGDNSVTIKWTATWNEDKTVTFNLTVNPLVVGLVPQLFVNGAYSANFTGAGQQFTLTTESEFNKDETPFSLYLTYDQGAVTESIPYAVGDSNVDTPDDGNDDDNTGDDAEGNEAVFTGDLTGTFTNAKINVDDEASDIAFELLWTATWNKDRTVTITISVDPVVLGLVPQLFINGAYSTDFTADGDYYTVTTADKFEEGQMPFSIYMSYAGGAVGQYYFGYEVGASGSTVGVERINNADRENDVYYNLNGIRVNKENLKPGNIYINNGKKIVIR